MESTENGNKKEKGSKAPRALKTQKDFLIQYMEENNKLLSKKFDQNFTYSIQQKMWEDLAKMLNQMGPSKSKEGWQKYWSDQCSRSKKKAGEVKRSIRQTGGGEGVDIHLSPSKERIVAMMGGDLTVEGHKDVAEFGVTIEPRRPDILKSYTAQNQAGTASTSASTYVPRTLYNYNIPEDDDENVDDDLDEYVIGLHGEVQVMRRERQRDDEMSLSININEDVQCTGINRSTALIAIPSTSDISPANSTSRPENTNNNPGTIGASANKTPVVNAGNVNLTRCRKRKAKRKELQEDMSDLCAMYEDSKQVFSKCATALDSIAVAENRKAAALESIASSLSTFLQDYIERRSSSE